MKIRRLLLVVPACLAPWCAVLRAAETTAEVKLTPLADRVRIEIGGQLFSEYIFTGASKPYLYPILAADGTRLNRDYPMASPPGEDHDHPHHRSLWFTHGAVNGQNFWSENPQAGKIVHEALLETKSGATGVLRARSRWEALDGKVVCTDETTVRVQAGPEGRRLDYEVTLHADQGALTFGDTKEGAMAMRLAQWMTRPHKYNKQDAPGAGHTVNSEGVRDDATWGKRAAWVDYFAPRDGKIYGVAVFDHPQNPRHPTWWHVRDYGLFAANPFGQHDFESLKDKPNAGDYTVPAGGSITFRYRFYFHTGDTTAAHIAERYKEYAAGR